MPYKDFELSATNQQTYIQNIVWILIAISLILPLIVSHYLLVSWSQALLGTGLLLDIVGAVFLATPDTNRIHRYFPSGRLRTALDHLKSPYSDVRRLVFSSRHDRIPAFRDEHGIFSVKNWISEEEADELIDCETYLKTVDIELRESSYIYIGFSEIIDLLIEFDDEYFDDYSWNDVAAVADIEKSDTVKFFIKAREENTEKYGHFYSKIEGRVEELESQLRRIGLALLISGFFLQFVSLLIN